MHERLLSTHAHRPYVPNKNLISSRTNIIIIEKVFLTILTACKPGWTKNNDFINLNIISPC